LAGLRRVGPGTQPVYHSKPSSQTQLTCEWSIQSRILILAMKKLLIALLIATLNTNVAANVVSPSNDFSNLAPSKISFRTGGLITGIVATLMMPWKLLADSDRYINGWLLGYSGGLGSIAGRPEPAQAARSLCLDRELRTLPDRSAQ